MNVQRTTPTQTMISPDDNTTNRLSRGERCSVLYLLLLYCVPTLAMTVWCIEKREWLAIAALWLGAILIAVLVAALTRTWGRFFLTLVPFYCAALVFAAYSLGFGIVPGRTLAILTLGASVEELVGLLDLWPDKWLLLPLVGILVSYLMLAWRLRAQKIIGHGTATAVRVGLLLTLPCAAVIAYDPSKAIGGFTFNPTIGSLMFLFGELPRMHAELYGAQIARPAFHAQRADRTEEVHILIAGESVRRDSWSAYGYHRATTPLIERLKDSVVLLTDAMADANLTNYSLEMMLTGMRPDEVLRERPRANLLDLAKEAGYDTTWLVNQDINISTTIGISPQHLRVPPDLNSNIYGRSTWDEVLLPIFRHELDRRGVPRFIGLHIMGSHWEYYRRYPPAFARYGATSKLNEVSYTSTSDQVADSVLNTYDNSLEYTDWFLNQLIEAARELDVPATLLYFPDHGEQMRALDGAAGHGQAAYAARQFEIPAFVWMNEAYKSRHPELAAAIRANASQEIRTHNVFYTEADLMGIAWPGEHSALSFASPQFQADVSRQHIAGGVLVTRP